MKELTVKQVEEVSGGNPAIAILAVLALRAGARMATPHIIKGAVAVASTIAGAIGAVQGYGAGK